MKYINIHTGKIAELITIEKVYSYDELITVYVLKSAKNGTDRWEQKQFYSCWKLILDKEKECVQE